MKVETLMENQREEFSRIVNILLAENCVYQYNKIKNFEKKNAMRTIHLFQIIGNTLMNIYDMQDGSFKKIVLPIWG